jgi:hypothetical protein
MVRSHQIYIKESGLIVHEPVNEFKSTELFNYLYEIDAEYAKRIENFVSKIAPILGTTQRHFPHYTRHDAHHGFRVCKRIYQITLTECFQKGSKIALTPAEAFLLIAAAYAHDLGMTVFPGEKDSLLGKLGIEESQDWETNHRLQNHLRQEHSKRGGAYINSNWETLQVPKNIVSPLHDLMRSHNMEISKLDFEFQDRIAAQEVEICIKQLSIILCIADALEFSDTRVVEGVLESLENKCGSAEKKSYMENMKHVCIGDGVAIGDDGTVIFSGTFDEAEVLSLAHNTIDNIQEWVRGYCDLERGVSLKRLKIKPQNFSRNLRILGADFERIGVRINKENIINLITSNSVWKSDLGFGVKELLQNSVEACRFRSYNTPIANRYKPKITVSFDREQKIITVTDNGCGMSKHTILSNFLTVGNSRSKDRAYISNKYDSLARFGIGFWSVFTIAKNATIKTAPYELLTQNDSPASFVCGCQFEVSIDKLKDYTLLKEIRLACGTIISLELKDYIVLDDVIEQFKNSVICSEIDIDLIIDGDIEKLSNTPPEITDRQIFGSKLALKKTHNIKTYNWSGSASNVDINVKFVYRMEDEHATFMMNNTSSLIAATDNLFNSSKVGVCGFSLPLRTKSTCFDLGRIGAFIANKSSPKGFEFTLDRQQLLETESSKNLSLEISNLIHQAYRAFLEDTNSYSPMHIYNLNMQSAMHGGNVFDQYTSDELRVAHDNYPDLCCFKLYNVESGVDFNSVMPIYVNLDTLLGMEGTIWLSQNSYKLTNNSPYGPNHYLHAENTVQIVFDIARSRFSTDADIYVIEPNRPASMLFDCDPESSIDFITLRDSINFCIQTINIASIDPNLKNEYIYDGVSGQWTGTIYLKCFSNPTGYPFIFLGRHRVLIEKNTKLSRIITELHSQKRFRKLAYIINLLNEAEQGFLSEELKGYW